MIDPSTGELSFNGGGVKFGKSTTPAALPPDAVDAPGPDLVASMKSKALGVLDAGDGAKFWTALDFFGDALVSARLKAVDPRFPPDLTDWSLDREMARHDHHCLSLRRDLGWLWRLRRYPWGRVQALCGRNLDKTPRESIIKVIYVEFAAVEELVAREFTS